MVNQVANTMVRQLSLAKARKGEKWGTLSSLLSPELHLIIFGGKGGSGKTTSAAATTLYLNRIYPNKKILVMSVDPAHSLADSFDVVVAGNKPTPIAENVWCLETDAAALLAEYKARYGDTIKKIAERATYFDKQDIESFFNLSLPGLDEVMAIIQIANLLKDGEYDLIIMDTAPTGHTKVLLSLPEGLEQWANLADMLMEKYRYMVKAMTGRYKEDECDIYIEEQRSDIRKVRALLTNARTTEFVPVTIPQPMSIFEVEKLVQSLLTDGITVKNVIVNQVKKESGCSFCSIEKQQQQGYVEDLSIRFVPLNLVKAPLFPHQIRGRQSLMEYARVIFEGADYSTPDQAATPRPATQIERKKPSHLSLQEQSFIIFGGKGGVGKSVIAAASALHIARSLPKRKVLIFSTDPAHSLSDAFAENIGNKITGIGQTDNLYALEIDGKELLEEFKQELKDAIEEAFDRFLGGNIDVKFDREILQELFSMIPPGLDELMSLRKILDFFKDGNYDLFILDSAASGHLIRFMELPRLAKDWLNTTFKLLIKYKGAGIGRFHNAAERLLELSKGVRETIEMFSDSKRTEFVMITIAEAMAVAEAEDLAGSLNNLRIPSFNLIVNMIIPPTNCAFCAIRREEQIKYLEEIEAKFPKRNVVYLPLFAQPVRGIEGLNKLAQVLYGA